MTLHKTQVHKLKEDSARLKIMPQAAPKPQPIQYIQDLHACSAMYVVAASLKAHVYTYIISKGSDVPYLERVCAQI